MDYPAIFSATLGLCPPWHIVSVNFAPEELRLDLRLEVFLGNRFTCPQCGKQKTPNAFEEETWFHEDFFGYATYLSARVPRLECEEGLVSVERPWSRIGSRFSRLLMSGAVVTAPAAAPPLTSRGAEPVAEAPGAAAARESSALRSTY